MSGPNEVDRLVAIIADGVRAKMMRPKCLARNSWLADDTPALLDRLLGELAEMRVETDALARTMRSQGNVPTKLEALACVRVFFEACDVSAFSGMLVDPRRLALRGIPHDWRYEVEA